MPGEEGAHLQNAALSSVENVELEADERLFHKASKFLFPNLSYLFPSGVRRVPISSTQQPRDHTSPCRPRRSCEDAFAHNRQERGACACQANACPPPTTHGVRVTCVRTPPDLFFSSP